MAIGTRRVAAFIAATMMTLLLASGVVLAAEVACKVGKRCVGTRYADTMQGTRSPDTISGLAGHDTMYGNLRDDRMLGGEGSDTMYGGYGLDTMYGEDGNDSMSGDHASDTIVGGAGTDVIDGDSGNDTVRADDGYYDSISCGTGRDDVAYVDSKDTAGPQVTFEDLVRLSTCERVVER